MDTDDCAVNEDQKPEDEDKDDEEKEDEEGDKDEDDEDDAIRALIKECHDAGFFVDLPRQKCDKSVILARSGAECAMDWALTLAKDLGGTAEILTAVKNHLTRMEGDGYQYLQCGKREKDGAMRLDLCKMKDGDTMTIRSISFTPPTLD